MSGTRRHAGTPAHTSTNAAPLADVANDIASERALSLSLSPAAHLCLVSSNATSNHPFYTDRTRIVPRQLIRF